MKKIVLALFIFWSFAAYAADKPVVTVSIAPQKYVVDRISGKTITVNVLVPAEADPHTFSPKPQDALMLAKSSLYLGIGFVFEESSLKQIASAYKNLQIVDSSAGIDKMEEHGHAHEDEAEHEEHEGEEHAEEHEEHLDPHVWVSPANMRLIARNTANALIAAYPKNKARYEAGLADLLNELDIIDGRFTALFAKKGKVEFMVYHPSLSYFARDYGLTQLAVEVDGKSPKAADLAALTDKIKQDKIKIFIVQPGSAGITVARNLGIPAQEVNVLSADWISIMDSLYKIFSK